MNWIFEGEPLTEIPEGIQGFVYLIEDTINGKFYLGKKNFLLMRTKQVNKKKKKIKVESDWQTYYGSNEELQNIVAANDPEKFTRTILRLCKTRSEMSYWETKLQFHYDVLLKPEKWYNSWISCKINRKQISKIVPEDDWLRKLG